MLSAPLLHWYLEHGLEVTDLHEVIEFSLMRCFSIFFFFFFGGGGGGRNAFPHAKRLTMIQTWHYKETHTKQLLIGHTVRHLLNNMKFCSTFYLNGYLSLRLVVNFRTAAHFSDEMYKIESAKNSVKMDIQIQIGFFILNFAKLRMLQFYYDCANTLIETNLDAFKWIPSSLWCGSQKLV